jgi:hypothetical protein
MSGDTRDVVEQLLSRMAEGDHARTAELFAEPVDWQLDWPSEDIRQCRGFGLGPAGRMWRITSGHWRPITYRS